MGWRCIRPSDLTLRHWPDGAVVFDDANAELQCLNPVSGMLLTLLLQRPHWSAQDLTRELFEDEPTVADVEMVENVLSEFSSLNFVEHVAV